MSLEIAVLQLKAKNGIYTYIRIVEYKCYFFTGALELLSLLVGAAIAIHAIVAELRQLEQLQHVRRVVHLASEVSVLQIQEEHVPAQPVAKAVPRFGLYK